MPSKKIESSDPGLPVTLSDFSGKWTVWAVIPFDPETQPHTLPVEYGDTIQITPSEPGYRVPGESNQCEAAAAVINLTRSKLTRELSGSEISVLQYLSCSAELSGTLIHQSGNEENEFVFNIKHVGEITEQIIQEMVRQFAGDEEKSKKLKQQVTALRHTSNSAEFIKRSAGERHGLRVRDLLFTWTNRFKHPGGCAHVHESE